MYTRLLVVLLLIANCSLSACAPAFIAAGAGAGYFLTHENARRKVDKFFRDLSSSIRQTTRKVYDEQWTQKQIAYDQNSGFVLKINKASLTPVTVKKGDKLKLAIQYVIMGGPETGVNVEEKQALFFEGKELTVLNNTANIKENGTWEDTLTFAVPDSADPGKYAISQEIRAKGITRIIKRSFTIR